MNNLSDTKPSTGIPIQKKQFFFHGNVCAVKNLFPHLQSKQTDKFFIVKV